MWSDKSDGRIGVISRHVAQCGVFGWTCRTLEVSLHLCGQSLLVAFPFKIIASSITDLCYSPISRLALNSHTLLGGHLLKATCFWKGILRRSLQQATHQKAKTQTNEKQGPKGKSSKSMRKSTHGFGGLFAHGCLLA